jgi:hypothetical protein
VKSRMVSIRFSQKDYEYLNKVANESNITLSEHLRRIICKTIPQLSRAERIKLLNRLMQGTETKQEFESN